MASLQTLPPADEKELSPVVPKQRLSPADQDAPRGPTAYAVSCDLTTELPRAEREPPVVPLQTLLRTEQDAARGYTTDAVPGPARRLP